MEAQVVINYTLLLLNLTNILLHSLGCCLLISLYRTGLRNSQQIYLINLSFCELLMNALEFSMRVTKVTTLPSNLRGLIVSIQDYVLIVMFSGIAIVFYMDLVYITLDRLMTVSYSLKYSAYWDDVKARRLVYLTWTVGIFSCVGMSLLSYYLNYNWKILYFKYIFPILETAFLFLVLLTYSTLFKEHKKSYRMSRQIRHCRTRSIRQRKVTTVMTVFWNSRFIVSILIICNFVVFMLAPCLVYLIYGILGNNQSDLLRACCWIAFAISNIVDSFNYIFLTGSVKSLMHKKAHRMLKSRSSDYKMDFKRRFRGSAGETIKEMPTKVWVTNWDNEIKA